MEESAGSRYWCHLCEQMVNPIIEQNQMEIKCPFCQSGFLEEMSRSDVPSSAAPDPDLRSDQALSLWAPILLGMMGHTRRRRPFRHLDLDNDDDTNTLDGGMDDHTGDTSEFIRRRRRSSATVLQLLQGIQAGLASESHGNGDERERVVLINPFNHTALVQGQNESQNPIGSLGDYFVGPGLDLLLQHLAENDPSRYGTPPAQKEAVEALPTVAIEENLQCSVCLDDFEAGSEAKEMPCKHKFHSACILPWLELHSSCPVCRFQLPADESKRDSDNWNVQRAVESGNSDASPANGEEEDEDHGDGRNGSGRRFSFPWPFSGLFSVSNAGNTTSNGSDSSHMNEN